MHHCNLFFTCLVNQFPSLWCSRIRCSCIAALFQYKVCEIRSRIQTNPINLLTKIQESMNQGNNVEVSHNGNPLECRGGGGRGGGLLRREVYRGEEAVRRSEVGPALCLCGGTDGGEEDLLPNLESTTFFYEISVRSTFGRMEAWSPIVRIPSPPSFLGALDRKSRNSLWEPELVRSGKSLESLAFAMLYDQGHIKFTDRLEKDIILSCNNISQSETNNTWCRLLVNT